MTESGNPITVSPSVHVVTGVQVGWPSKGWNMSAAQRVHAASVLGVGKVDVKKPGEQTVAFTQATWSTADWKVSGGHAAHRLFVVGVGAWSSKDPGAQWSRVVHTRSVVVVDIACSYSSTVQTDTSLHTRSDVGVGACRVYSVNELQGGDTVPHCASLVAVHVVRWKSASAAQPVQGTQCRSRSGWHGLASNQPASHGVHGEQTLVPTSSHRVVANLPWPHTAQPLHTASDVAVQLVTTNVEWHVEHALHSRSVDVVGGNGSN